MKHKKNHCLSKSPIYSSLWLSHWQFKIVIRNQQIISRLVWFFILWCFFFQCFNQFKIRIFVKYIRSVFKIPCVVRGFNDLYKVWWYIFISVFTSLKLNYARKRHFRYIFLLWPLSLQPLYMPHISKQFKLFRCRGLTWVDVHLALPWYSVAMKLSNFYALFSKPGEFLHQ